MPNFFSGIGRGMQQASPFRGGAPGGNKAALVAAAMQRQPQLGGGGAPGGMPLPPEQAAPGGVAVAGMPGLASEQDLQRTALLNLMEGKDPAEGMPVGMTKPQPYAPPMPPGGGMRTMPVRRMARPMFGGG